MPQRVMSTQEFKRRWSGKERATRDVWSVEYFLPGRAQGDGAAFRTEADARRYASAVAAEGRFDVELRVGPSDERGRVVARWGAK